MAGEHFDDDQTSPLIDLSRTPKVSHYAIVRKIGSGGMGEVYLAEDTELNRKVALKFLSSHLCQDADCRARFKREAQAAARLNHPNIVTIFEVSEFNGRPFFAMEFIEGQSLRELIKTKELTIERVIELAIQICEGLHKAHQSGIIHRDIKPANILIDADGRARILDFGLAAVQGCDHLTKAGSTLGTVGYMSPEQVRGEQVDHRTDIFSLGIVLYELITARQPFRGDNDAVTLHHIVDAEPEPLSRYKSGVPDGLQGIVAKALAKDRSLRYQHVDDLLVDLKGICRQPALQILAKQPSIAVLPFVNLSSDLEQEYFCDGMAEEIINALSQLENLRVIARTSAFSFKGKNEDVREIARKLGVETLLEGSVRKAGNHLRVTAQLIAAGDGSHLWSERYDKEMKDVFAIQDEISLAIVDRLRIRLLGDEKDNLMRSRARNVEAYNLYLQGRYCWNKRMATGLKRAIGYFEQAIEKDPDFALAYTGLADCYSLMHQEGGLSPVEAFPKALTMALKALEKDELLAEAHSSLALIAMDYEWDWPKAEREFRRAIELSPGYATAHHWYAIYLELMKRTAQAIEEISKAQTLDPLSLVIRAASAIILNAEGESARAEEQCQEVLRMGPDWPYVHYIKRSIYERRGMHDEAIREYLAFETALGRFGSHDLEALEQAYEESGCKAFWRKHVDLLKEYAGQSYISAAAIAQDYARLDELDQAFEWLDRACQQRDPWLIWLRVDPPLSSLISERRFVALLKKMGLEA